MRLAGFAMILASSYLLGVSLKKVAAGRCACLRELEAWAKFAKNAVTHELYTASELIERSAENERFSRLAFFENAALGIRKDEELNAALSEAFCEWASDIGLSGDDVAAAKTFFLSFGSENEQAEINKLCAFNDLLEASANESERELLAKKGYYETVCTLGGALLILVLM